MKNNSDILISKSDKGNVTLIMNRDFYNEKIEQLLNDKKTYEKIKNPTNYIQTILNNMVDDLWCGSKIDDKTRKFLKCNNGLPPKFYGLIKTHKIDYPIRPVIIN